MKVATKLSAAFGVLVLVLVSLLVYHVRTLHQAVSTNFELSEISSRLYLSTSRQLGWINDLEENASKYWVTRDPGYLEIFDAVMDEFDAGLHNLSSFSLRSEEREEVARLEELWAEFRPMGERLETLAAARAPGAASESLRDVRRQLDRLRWQARSVSDASQSAMIARLEASANAAQRAERISWGAGAGAFLLSVLVAAFIVRSISRSLTRLKEGTHEVAAGNFSYRLRADHGDEFAQLAHDFNVMTRRLGELDEMKRDFLSKVSHDLKTPLASMQETVQILLDEVPGPLTPKQERLLRLNHQSAQRLSAMIADILDLSAMEAGAFTLDFRRHELSRLLRTALEPLELTLQERGLQVAVEPPATALHLECDGGRIIQVLMNLLENAIKFSPAGGTIRIDSRLLNERPDEVPAAHWQRLARPEDGEGAVLLRMTDAGPGIPVADREKIFERFFQSGNGGRVQNRGVGLGLAICREIVEAHQGAIWVTDNPAGGSIFHLLLPRALPDTTKVPAQKLVAGPETTSSWGENR